MPAPALLVLEDGRTFHGASYGAPGETSGEAVFYVSNRAELVCADVKGDGKGKAKFLWKYDMRKELGVHICYLPSSSPLVIGDLVYVLTGNGVEVQSGELPNPNAPSFVAVNKKTGVDVVVNRTWKVTLSVGTYKFRCDAHPTKMHGSFNVS